MNLPFSNLVSSRKLEFSIFVAVITLIFKILVPVASGWFLQLINEILIFSAIYFGILYSSEFTALKKNNPITLIINAGILNALLFFLTALSSSLFDVIPKLSSNINTIYAVTSILISFVFIGSITYIFSVFKELYFLRVKRDTHKVFDAMILFFTLTFFTAFIPDSKDNPNFYGLTFFVVSIVLMSLNSFRVSWIAFLTKKQKIYLLIISIVLALLFGFNFGLTFDNSFIKQLLENFSPGLQISLRLIMLYGTIYCGIIFFTSLFHLPTAEAFDRKAEEASSLMDLSKLITQVFDLKELGDTITSLTVNVCSSDSAWLVIRNGNDLQLTSVKNIDFRGAQELTNFFTDDNLLQPKEFVTLSQSRIQLILKNNFNGYSLNALAIAPLDVHNVNKGFLFAARKHDFVFDEDEQKSIEAFADYAAVALENAKLIEESFEKERLRSELNVAREIQYKILPSKTPSTENLNISALFIPAFEVGGDYYDFFNINEDKLAFVIADVSGKGISAAFIMAEVKGIFESLSRLVDSPKKLLIEVNKILSNSLEKKSFVTAIYGYIDKKSGKLTFARAGHMPLYIARYPNIETFVPSGIGLGLDYGSSFSDNISEITIDLRDDDLIVLFTDGIPESKNVKLEEFGYKRFEKIICSKDFSDTEELKLKIMNKISSFSEGNSQHDDITLVLMKWKSTIKPSGVN